MIKEGITLDRALDAFQDIISSDVKNTNFLTVSFKTSVKQNTLSRNSMKIDRFAGNLLSILLNFSIVFAIVNKFINSFEYRKKLIFALFKNFELNTTMMLKLRELQEKYNEVEYKKNPDFNEFVTPRIVESKNLIDSPDQRLSKTSRSKLININI